MEKTYDIFISYRRDGGKEYARTLKPELEKRGYRVFLDYDELNDGVFDQRIKNAINNSSVFLLILSKGSLDRCANDGDWVREEILHALKCSCHIIPVEFDKSFRKIPETIPSDISAIVGAHSWAQIDTESLFQESIDKMVQNRIHPFVCHEEIAKPITSKILQQNIEVHINVDADCELFRFNSFVTSLAVGKDNVIKLTPGKYKFDFVSTLFPKAKNSQIYTLTPDVTCDYLEVSLMEKVEAERAKQMAEEEAKQRAELKAMRRAQQEANIRAKQEAKLAAQREKREKEVKEVAIRRAEKEVKKSRRPNPLLKVFDFFQQVREAMFSPDGTLILVSLTGQTQNEKDSIEIYELQTGTLVNSINIRGLKTFNISPNGSHIIISSDDDGISLWNAKTGVLIYNWKEYHDIHSITYDTDGTRIAMVDQTYEQVYIVNSHSGECIKAFNQEDVWKASFSPDGRFIVTSSGGISDKKYPIYIRNTQSFSTIKKLKGHLNSVSSVEYSPFGIQILSSSFDNTVRIWNANTGFMSIFEQSCLMVLEHPKSVSEAHYSPNGHHIVTACYDNRIRIWDAQNGMCLRKLWGHNDYIHSLAYNRDGSRIMSSDSESVRIWDATTIKIDNKVE